MNTLTSYKSDPLHTMIYRDAHPEDTLAKIYGQRYRQYRKKWSEASNCKLVQKYPLHLNFEVFYGCNLRCSMCVHSIHPDELSYKIEPAKKVSFEKYREIIDEGVKFGLYSVQLNGSNEPLLQRDLIEYISYAKQAKIIDIFIVTNATLLTADIARKLIESGLTQIKFSMDSIHKKTYEKIRVGGDFEKTMENISNFLEIKKSMGKNLPITRVSFVKTKENEMELDEFVNYWSKKVDYIMVQDMVNPFIGKDKYDKFQKEFRVDGVKLKDCAMPYQRLFIRNNGDVLPCCSTYGYELPVGNIYGQSIFEIWNGNLMSRIRRSVNDQSQQQPLPCKKCRQALLV